MVIIAVKCEMSVEKKCYDTHWKLVDIMQKVTKCNLRTLSHFFVAIAMECVERICQIHKLI